MSAPIPKTAMVFAAGLGQRMRPITDTLPKPLVRIRGRALIDHCLDRLAENGVETAIVNVHWLADQIEAHLARRERPRIVISDERDKLLDQGGGIKRVLPLLGEAPFLVCNTDAFWIEGPRSNIARLAEAFDPETMDIALLVAASAGSVGVDWPGDFTMTRDGRLGSRLDRHVAPFVYTGVGMQKPRLFADETGDVVRLAPYFHAAAARGRLYGVRLDGLWLHVGRPEAIAEAEAAIERSIL
ncbi:MurNAc alpha-1-phosphate uridylyltransferase [Roseiarcus fermentans]|uniref:MurNAc alpha-1-phosphate uridylyltransferase n=1 Tax=Roseiarcus fermentans TaxID=1473586 RepID=A0A366F1Z6_9HYPH|nr:MurNAc alpha-1-phosphate uridylyltransferase [Roseiarcus fermentans]